MPCQDKRRVVVGLDAEQMRPAKAREGGESSVDDPLHSIPEYTEWKKVWLRWGWMVAPNKSCLSVHAANKKGCFWLLTVAVQVLRWTVR